MVLYHELICEICSFRAPIIFYNPKLDAKFPHFLDKREKETHLENKYLYWVTEVYHLYPWKQRESVTVHI